MSWSLRMGRGLKGPPLEGAFRPLEGPQGALEESDSVGLALRCQSCGHPTLSVQDAAERSWWVGNAPGFPGFSKDIRTAFS